MDVPKLERLLQDFSTFGRLRLKTAVEKFLFSEAHLFLETQSILFDNARCRVLLAYAQSCDCDELVLFHVSYLEFARSWPSPPAQPAAVTPALFAHRMSLLEDIYFFFLRPRAEYRIRQIGEETVKQVRSVPPPRSLAHPLSCRSTWTAPTAARRWSRPCWTSACVWCWR